MKPLPKPWRLWKAALVGVVIAVLGTLAAWRSQGWIEVEFAAMQLAIWPSICVGMSGFRNWAMRIAEEDAREP